MIISDQLANERLMTKLQFFQLKKNGISIFNVNTSVYTSILVYPLYRENRVKSPPRKYTVRCTVIFYCDTFHFVDINKSFLEGKLVGVWTEEESQRVTALIKNISQE